MYNKVFLIGNLAKDPELRYTPSGVPVVRMVLAVNRPKAKNSQTDGKGDVDFVPIVAWRRLAEICGEYLKKGRPISIEGRLQVRSYEKAGVKKTMSEVVADGMQMLGRKSDGAGPSAQNTSSESGENETPF